MKHPLPDFPRLYEQVLRTHLKHGVRPDPQLIEQTAGLTRHAISAGIIERSVLPTMLS